MIYVKFFLSLTLICNLAIIFYSDIRYRLVEHEYILGVLIISSICVIFSNNYLSQLISALLIFSSFFLLWMFNVVGGSDVKLIGALFIGISDEYAYIALLFIGILGGGQILLMWLSVYSKDKSPFDDGVPYTIPIGISGWFFLTLSLF